jgi:hypothetical protein
MLLFWDCYAPFLCFNLPKQRKVWYKGSCMLGEWSDGLNFGKGSGTAGMPLVSTTALLLSRVETPLSKSGFDRNISVHTQLDSGEYKSGGTMWPRLPGD